MAAIPRPDAYTDGWDPKRPTGLDQEGTDAVTAWRFIRITVVFYATIEVIAGRPY